MICNILLAPPLQKRPPIHYKLQNHYFSSTTLGTSNVKIHFHTKMHQCAKFYAIWAMFALDLVMIHHICLTCNEPSTLLFIFVKRCVNQLLQLKFLNANRYYVWNKGTVPMFHIFSEFALNFYCSGQTLVNYGQRQLAHISRARYWAYFMGTNGLQCFALDFVMIHRCRHTANRPSIKT